MSRIRTQAPITPASMGGARKRAMHTVLRRRFLRYYIALVAAAIIFLIVFAVTEIDFMMHLAAIPLEILLATFVVDQVLRLQERQTRRRRLLGEAAGVFHSQIQAVIAAGIRAAHPPDATLPKLESLGAEELRQLRASATTVTYLSAEEMEAAIDELVDAEPTWESMLAQAIEYDVDETYVSMMRVLDFVRHVKAFRQSHPHQSFAEFALSDDAAMERVRRVSKLAAHRYLDLLIDFRQHDPDMFRALQFED